MKKIFAVVIAAAVALCLSVSAFAASPVANPIFQVSVLGGTMNGAAATTPQGVQQGNSVSFTASTTQGTFNNWTVYKVVITYAADGKTITDKKVVEAVAGVDYKVEAGDTSSAELKIVPLTTGIVVAGNYDGKTTDPQPMVEQIVAAIQAANTTNPGTDGSQTSPPTGDYAVLYFVMVMMAAAGCGFVAKKQLAK